MPVSSLNRQVSFQQVLPLLGCTVKSTALPTLATCPVCFGEQQLTISLDVALGGEWAYCRACKFAGDMITLASEAWKLGIPLTLRRLAGNAELAAALADQQAIDRYIDRFHQPAVRYARFWEKCQANHTQAETAGLRMLHRHFGVLSSAEDWPQRAGQFIGSASKQEVDATIQPKKSANWEEIKNQRAGSFPSETLRGGKWDDLLVVPFWDLPGRISAFLLIGREGRVDQDFLYKNLFRDTGEGGLAMLPALLDGLHVRLGSSKFIMTDVDVAIRFHARHSRDHLRPLPLAVAWDDGKNVTTNIWQWLQSRHMIFWGSDRLKTIAQARRASGRVSMLQVTPLELDTNMRNYSPVEWLERMKLAAVPWEAALQDYFRTLDDQGIDEALLSLNFQGRELTEFIACCKPDIQDRLRFISEHKIYANREQFEGRWITQKSDGWFLDRNNERISNAVVTIEQVLTTLDNKSYYRGTIKFAGGVYPFTEKAATLDRGMLEWAQAYLRDQCRAGVCEYYPSWNKKSVHLAIKFSKPAYAQGVEVIGWDAVNRQFNFPQFAIRHGGKITTDFACLFDNPHVPARELSPPQVFPRGHIAELSGDNDETQIFWAVAACVAANIIAAAVNRNQVPIILSGEGAVGVGGTAALRLGCVPVVDAVTVADRRAAAATLPAYRWNAGWPAIVRVPAGEANFAWFDQPQSQHCIFNLTDLAGSVVAMRGRTNMVRQTRKLGSLQLLHHAAPYVLPHYRQDLYRRGLLLADEQPDLASNVLFDIAGWFERIGGNRAVVERAAALMHTPLARPASDYFCRMVLQLYQAGKLPYDKADFSAVGAASAIVEIEQKGRFIWISQDRFSDCVKSECGLSPDLLLITNSLAGQGVLLSEPALERVQGWLLPYEWWNQQLSKWRDR